MSRRACHDVPIGTRSLEPLAWGLLCATMRLFGSEKVRKALDGFSVYVDYTRCDTSFAVSRERALLAAEGVPFPDSEVFFAKCVDYALAENFGKPLPKRAKARASVIERIE